MLKEMRAFHAVHEHPAYDLEIDTSLVTPEHAAERIAELITTTPRPTAFANLLAGRQGP